VLQYFAGLVVVTARVEVGKGALRVLQCAAVRGSVLKNIAAMTILAVRDGVGNTHAAGVLQSSAVCCSVLQYVAVYCSMLQ